jgi:hypothetical protein
MRGLGLRDGDKFTVLVVLNEEHTLEVTGEVVSPTEVITNVYTDDSKTLLLGHEVLSGATSAVGYHLNRPSLKALIAERIAELKEISEGADEDDPPAPSTSDIPF